MSELYWNTEHTAYGVLVSRGFGAGWSSWNTPRIAYDKKVIDYWLEHRDTCNSQQISDDLAKLGFPGVYVSRTNWFNLDLEWVPAGVRWRIHEYDGAETVEHLNMASYICFDSNGEPM